MADGLATRKIAAHRNGGFAKGGMSGIGRWKGFPLPSPQFSCPCECADFSLLLFSINNWQVARNLSPWFWCARNSSMPNERAEPSLHRGDFFKTATGTAVQIDTFYQWLQSEERMTAIAIKRCLVFELAVGWDWPPHR